MKHFSVFFLAAFLFLPIRLLSMDWPSSTAVMTRNFGWNDNGLPHLGISFDDQGPLSAAEDGELLFQRGESDTASRFPSPLGCWAALDHGDGIISIYSRFDGTQSPVIPGQVEKGRTLGDSGISGWSSRNGFYFQLFDRKERRWINPAMIIAPPEDMRLPAIIQVRLKDAQGNNLDPSQTKTLSQGRYTVCVEAVTRSARESPLAPYRIICSLNGSEAGVLNFETFSARDGSLVVNRNGLVPVRQVYAPVPGYEIADVWFTRGQTTLEIIAQDIAGNSRNMVYRLTVE